MIATTKVFALMTGSSAAAVVGLGPVLHSDTALTAMIAAGAATIATGVYELVRPATAER